MMFIAYAAAGTTHAYSVALILEVPSSPENDYRRLYC